MITPAQAVENIKQVKVQGAREIAVYALKFLKDFVKKNGFGLKFEVAAMMLENARPTAVVLHNVLETVKIEKSLSSINRLLNQLETSKKKIARIGNKIIKRNSRIMTHCHSGEALAVIKNSKNKKISVIGTHTEPLEQGIKTAKELATAKIPTTLINDLAIGHFMKDVDMVIVGADALRLSGFVNKIGTHILAEEARRHKKPFYVVANTLKFDKRKKLVIEERPSVEIHKKIKGVKIRNPSFDLVSWKLVTAVVTEKGIFKPEKIVRMLK